MVADPFLGPDDAPDEADPRPLEARPEAPPKRPNGLASERTDGTYRVTYAVSSVVAAPIARVWALLVDVGGWPRWHRGVSAVAGRVDVGDRIHVTVSTPPVYTVAPRVVTLDPPHRMVWRDGFAPLIGGTRTFELAAEGARTRFEMTETLHGISLPLVRPVLPDLRQAFDLFAADLRAEAEGGTG